MDISRLGQIYLANLINLNIPYVSFVKVMHRVPAPARQRTSQLFQRHPRYLWQETYGISI